MKRSSWINCIITSKSQMDGRTEGEEGKEKLNWKGGEEEKLNKSNEDWK